MDSRQRFIETMRFGAPDRPPLFEEGIRDEVLETWRGQGLPAGVSLEQVFHFDERLEIDLDVEPRQDLARLAILPDGLEQLRRSLDPDDSSRLPSGWQDGLKAWRHRQHPLMLQVHEGLFLSLGVEDARTFTRAIYLLADQPDYVRGALYALGELAAGLAERLLSTLSIDAAIFSEPIACPHGPLISPRAYTEFMLSSYTPLLEVLRRRGVETIILRTYANARRLLPAIFDYGFNCLWACETAHPQAMDYLALRQEFGRELRLIGGIDVDVLSQGRQAIQRELETKVPPLLAQGGYVPLADGRVRQIVPYDNYVYYRRLLEEITTTQ